MIARRVLLQGGAALALLSRASAAPSRIAFRGSYQQGALLIGELTPGVAVSVDGKPVQVSPQGLFALGIAWDGEKPIRIAAAFPDEPDYVAVIQPVKRLYDIQAINGLPPAYVEPPPEIAARQAIERERIWKAREPDTAGVGFSQALVWPFAGRLSGVFGSQRILNGKPMAPHLAVDVAGPLGTLIHAAADGVVTIADDFYLEGGFTLIDHGHGVSTCYLHQSSRLVEAGDRVQRGDVIGQVGMTGRATGPHCHWGLNWFQMKLDPSLATVTPTPSA
jgi:murein DD-endopeptidase MepM/ murein hydrolase activator NlpD